MITLVEHPSEREASFRLHRLIEWAGVDHSTLSHAKVGEPVTTPVVLAMGQGAMEDQCGIKRRILDARGYVYPGAGDRSVVPTVHPAFIQRGNAKWSAAFINDLQKAMALARGEATPQVADYLLDPSPLDALRWAQVYRERLRVHERLRLAFDIETPYKGDEEDDLDLGDAPDASWNIERIGFSYEGLMALSIPWAPEYRAAIRLCMESPGEKVVWNAGFDVPRIRRAGVAVNGLTHDGMVAWHILHSDLPKRLAFVATFTCPWQPAWKHLSGAKPAFYNATDADVEWRAFDAIEAELRRVGLLDTYQRDVVDLEPVLAHMTEKGMPVDAEIRLDRAIKLDTALKEAKATLEALTPMEARKIEHVYKSDPKDTTGLRQRKGMRTVPVCSSCGAERPRKPHFQRFKKKRNPCADGRPIEREVPVIEYYRFATFSPSRDQLIRYHSVLKRPLPTKWDKAKGAQRVSFDEENIKKLILAFPDDKIYPLILTYRGIDKLAGTYIGRPV